MLHGCRSQRIEIEQAILTIPSILNEGPLFEAQWLACCIEGAESQIWMPDAQANQVLTMSCKGVVPDGFAVNVVEK